VEHVGERTLMDRFSLEGRTIVITGASSGLGAGFAHALASCGANLALGARRADRLDAVAHSVRASTGQTVFTRVLDVTIPDDGSALVAEAMDVFGRVDGLVNNAGLGTAVPARRETPEEFRAVIEVNLEGAYWMAQACGRVMQQGASIVNVSSVLALIRSYAPQAAYSASKAGLIGLTRDLAQQWSGRYGIRVNALAPGYFRSEMTDDIPQDRLGDFITSTALLGRMGEQHELDAALLFLLSDASSYITGTTLVVDGGMSTR
jgi:NAD(P)-dependent dehydrogenase (short-subunit alcohol dehydrogenase family)